MAFVRRKRPTRHQIGLELEVVGDDVCATIRAPVNSGPPLKLERVPLRQAILLVAKLAHWSDSDVAVIDRHGLWPEDSAPSEPPIPWSD